MCLEPDMRTPSRRRGPASKRAWATRAFSSITQIHGAADGRGGRLKRAPSSPRRNVEPPPGALSAASTGAGQRSCLLVRREQQLADRREAALARRAAGGTRAESRAASPGPASSQNHWRCGAVSRRHPAWTPGARHQGPRPVLLRAPRRPRHLSAPSTAAIRSSAATRLHRARWRRSVASRMRSSCRARVAARRGQRWFHQDRRAQPRPVRGHERLLQGDVGGRRQMQTRRLARQADGRLDQRRARALRAGR